jgi:hypothetical protein
VTLREWLHERRPQPPERLLANIEAVLGDRLSAGASSCGAVCLDAAEALLRDLVTRPEMGRDAALDLLTVDALTTYAFEAAASEPDTLSERASAAMTRFANCLP